MADNGMSLGQEELTLGLKIQQAVDDNTAYEFCEITYFDDSDAVLVRVRKKDPVE